MAKEKSPAFQFYPKDYLGDFRVMALSWQQRGIYLHLLCVCWLEGSLPNVPAYVAAAIGAELGDVAAVLKLFDDAPDNKLIHKRLDKERKSQKRHKKAKSDAGKKGAAKRWQSDGIAIALPMAKDSSSSPSPSSIESTSKSKERENPLSLVQGDSETERGKQLALDEIRRRRGNSVAEKDGGASGPESKRNTSLTGGGSQDDAGPPLPRAVELTGSDPDFTGEMTTAKYMNWARDRTDSHELGQTSAPSPVDRGNSVSAGAAPFSSTDGAGAGNTPLPEAGIITPKRCAKESADRFKSDPAPFPTEDEFFNAKIYDWWRGMGGSCASVDVAYRAFMGAIERYQRYEQPKGFLGSRAVAVSDIKADLPMWTAHYEGLPPAGHELANWLRDKLNPGAKMQPYTKHGARSAESELEAL